ncbi:hypothetical protein QBC39DRAFT_353632 [Podospora conica]|nr:hypothetical protein QBC39DRAFT_353632 [Schizothecium conicum]
MPVFRLVEWNNWRALWGADAVLIPVEYTATRTGNQTMPWERRKRTRCVVVSRFGNAGAIQSATAIPTAQAGVFMGVVDLERGTGGPDDFVNVAEGNLALDEPITLL